MNISSKNKCVIYTRVSTDEQAVNGVSLDAQEKQCSNYAKSLGLDVVRVFREEGVSAKTITRPALSELLHYLTTNQGIIDTLVVWKIDRVSRNYDNYRAFKKQLASHGINILSSTETFEDNASGHLTEGFLGLLAQFENETKSERTTLGMTERVESGCWIHVAPLGYKNIRDDQGRPTVAPDKYANSVKRLLEMFSLGSSTQKQLVIEAKVLDIKSVTGKDINFSTIGKMLRNPLYAGMIKSSLSDELIPGIHDGLIDWDTYLKIQLLLTPKLSLTSGKQVDTFWPLRGGVMRCANCDLPITGGSPKGFAKYYPKYQCRKCTKKLLGVSTSIDRSKLHLEFEALLKQISPDETILESFKRKVMRSWKSRIKDVSSKRALLQTKLTKLESQKDRVLELFIDGSLDYDEKSSQLLKIGGEISLVQNQLRDLTSIKEEKVELLDYCVNFISNLAQIWNDADVDSKIRLQHIIFPEGLVYEFGHGFRTPVLSPIFRYITEQKEPSNDDDSSMVPLERFELPTPSLGRRRSIH